MAVEPIGLFARLWLAFLLPWKVLFDGLFAARTRRLIDGAVLDEEAPPKIVEKEVVREVVSAPIEPEPVEEAPTDPGVEPVEPEPVEPEPVPEAPAAAPGTDPTTALQLLGILQREGRFVDFLQEDVTDFSDADIGAAARVVHEGCKRGLAEYLELAVIRGESEGDAVELPEGFDPTRVRLTGNVTGEPPYRGQLAHHGWQVVKIALPTLSDGTDPKVVAPAEVEL